ncbi:MAG: HD domain-containing protein [Planctomycetota bacterium]|nr:HD domain-containing protein [Planctomycetota bacterium]
MVLDNLATFDQQNEVVQSVVKALSMALDMHDPIMMGHSERVGKFSASVGEFLGFNAEQVNDLYLAGVLHDIGRLGQNDDIVETQRAILRGEEKPIVEHVKLGVKILSEIVTLDRLIPIVKAHHEFWDGSGLPDGLSREDIPLGGRVLCAANVLDEFLYPLVPEKDPMSVGEAMKEMKLLGGSKLDPKVVNAFMIAYRKGKLSLEDSTDISI